MTQKVFFVGMHNKPGMQPLDSRTGTGISIDRVIELLPQFECIKTNLCDMDYLPSNEEVNLLAIAWHERHQPGPQDVIVLLGRWVQQHFRHGRGAVLAVKHPAAIKGCTNRCNYYEQTAIAIHELGLPF